MERWIKEGYKRVEGLTIGDRLKFSEYGPIHTITEVARNQKWAGLKDERGRESRIPTTALALPV